jgi:hypothetical protein
MLMNQILAVAGSAKVHRPAPKAWQVILPDCCFRDQREPGVPRIDCPTFSSQDPNSTTKRVLEKGLAGRLKIVHYLHYPNNKLARETTQMHLLI